MHGVGGVGKTSFAAGAEAPVFLIDRQEMGIHELRKSGQIKREIPVMPAAETWLEVQEMLAAVAEGGYQKGYRTLVVDSLTGMEYLCFRHHCDEAFAGDWTNTGFFSYQQGPRNAAKTVWPDFLGALDAVRDSGMNVILIGHSRVATFNNPDGANYDRWVPYLDKETWAITYRWCELCLFANYFVDLEQKAGSARKKATGGRTRYLHTEWNATYDAKHRWNMREFIDMGTNGEEAFTAFSKLIPK